MSNTVAKSNPDVVNTGVTAVVYDRSYTAMCELIDTDCAFQCTDGYVHFHKAIVARHSKYVYRKLLEKCPPSIKIDDSVQNVISALHVLYEMNPTVKHENGTAHKALTILEVDDRLLDIKQYISKDDNAAGFVAIIKLWKARGVTQELVDAQLNNYNNELDLNLVRDLNIEDFKYIISLRKPNQSLDELVYARYYHDLTVGNDTDYVKVHLGEYGTSYKPLNGVAFKYTEGMSLIVVIRDYIRKQALAGETGIEIFHPEIINHPCQKGLLWRLKANSGHGSIPRTIILTDEEDKKIRSLGNIPERPRH